MVKETRIAFGPDDLVQMRVVCRLCGGEATFPVGRTLRVPDRCPYCLEEWYDKHTGTDRVTTHMLNLIQAVHFLTDPDNQCDTVKLAFNVRFEIDGEGEK